MARPRPLPPSAPSPVAATSLPSYRPAIASSVNSAGRLYHSQLMRRLSPEALVYETTSAVEPQVSHDGTRIVYTLSRADRDLDRATSQIYLSAIDGSDVRQLTRTGERNREPRWSPD